VIEGYPGIVLGNVVGSNIANVLLVAGVSAVIYPLAYPGGGIRRDSAIMMVASALFVALCIADGLDRPAGFLLLVGLVVALTPTVRDAAQAQKEGIVTVPTEIVLSLPTRRRLITTFIVVGLIALPLGARIVVRNAVAIATAMGVTETVIGLTIIAFSTSLPELATTMVAAYKRHTEVAVGTIVGSNIFNILAIMGVAALMSPGGIQIPETFPYLDLPVMMAAALVVTVLAWARRPLGRVLGLVLALAYAGYIVTIFVMA
jgi:cation:H+ antiporter